LWTKVTASAALALRESQRARTQEERATREAKRALSLSGIPRFQDLAARAQALWPRRPENIEKMETWLKESRNLEAEVPTYHSYLAELEAEGTGEYEKQWLHDNLQQLVTDLGQFQGVIADVEQRREIASTVVARTIDEYADAWEAAQDAIERHPLYHGLKLDLQVGLVPLGPDPESTLWEFWLWESGEQPERDETTQHWKITARPPSCWFLLPGGTFFMGAQGTNPREPNYDPAALFNESPVKGVPLEPFFLSKYEITQGQWHRVMALIQVTGVTTGILRSIRSRR
jgi:hypothetical protein